MKNDPGNTPTEEQLGIDLRSCFPSADYPKSRVEYRIRASLTERPADRPARLPEGRALPAWARFGLAAAAALALFIGGAEYGRRTTLSAIETGPGQLQIVDNGSLPIAIQGSGTRYVAALARLSDEGEKLSAAERRVAVEVALAALYAASVELLREDGNDESLRTVAELVDRKRNEVAASENQNQF